MTPTDFQVTFKDQVTFNIKTIFDQYVVCLDLSPQTS